MSAVEPFYAELGRLITEFRIKKNLSKAELGRQLNPKLSRASVANIESGKQRILVHQLAGIATALEVELSEIVPIQKQKKATSEEKPVPIRVIVDTLQGEGIPQNSIKKIKEKIEGDKK